MSLFGTGITALNAAQLGLAVTQHNISNVNTAGYSRQAAMQVTNGGMMTGVGAIGQGVRVNTILRYYDDILTKQVNDAQTRSSELDAQYAMIARIDNLLADPNAGLSPVLASFFQAVQDVAANPTLVSARQSMTSGAEALVTRFQTLSNRLTQLYDETNSQLKDVVNEINAYSRDIAKLNERIIAQSNTGHPPNDLLDQRDQLVLELNKLVRVNTYLDSDNSLTVLAGNGHALVVNTSVMELETRPATYDPERLVIAAKGGAAELPETYLDGGILGGLLAFRRESLDQAANALGQVAASIALTVNAQQQLGQDLLGAIKGEAGFVENFFKLSAPKTIANANNADPGVNALLTFNPPQMSENGNYYTDLTTSDYEVRFTSATTYEVKRLSDKNVITGTVGVPLSFDGLTLDFDPLGTHATGDTYLLQPTREVARNISVNQDIIADVRRIAAAMPIRTAASAANTGNAVISAGSVVDAGYLMTNLPQTIRYDATGPQLTGFDPTSSIQVKSGGVTTAYPAGTTAIPYQSGDTIVVDGFSFNVTGVPADGDEFTLERNVGGTADARNIVQIGALQTALTMNGDGAKGVSTFQVAYAQLVSNIGAQTKSILVNGQSQETVLQQAVEARSTVAGVNLDEEAVNLLKYQYAYQAAARVMNTVSTLFDTLLSIGA
ncbi:MAG: flagellar hook-associated protein FlgK [Zoogloeaceae bacterium]|jgi:flagellar hook-associated protein 1 FlgK|nr:flagellar hook-associated protein FlgK [Zoogloeaceae bacterium]